MCWPWHGGISVGLGVIALDPSVGVDGKVDVLLALTFGLVLALGCVRVRVDVNTGVGVSVAPAPAPGLSQGFVLALLALDATAIATRRTATNCPFARGRGFWWRFFCRSKYGVCKQHRHFQGVTTCVAEGLIAVERYNIRT